MVHALLPKQEAEGEDCVGKLGALDADIRCIQARLQRVASEAIPRLPAGLHHAMLNGGSGGNALQLTHSLLQIGHGCMLWTGALHA